MTRTYIVSVSKNVSSEWKHKVGVKIVAIEFKFIVGISIKVTSGPPQTAIATNLPLLPFKTRSYCRGLLI